jgi:hypothetical protein
VYDKGYGSESIAVTMGGSLAAGYNEATVLLWIVAFIMPIHFN